MTYAESQFLALKDLVKNAKEDPDNIGWYMLKSYLLGENKSALSEIFELPPKMEPKYELRIVE